jgi:hypothetical protein
MITRGFSKGTIVTRGLGVTGIIQASYRELVLFTVKIAQIVTFTKSL